jgi:hypothetical protein
MTDQHLSSLPSLPFASLRREILASITPALGLLLQRKILDVYHEMDRKPAQIHLDLYLLRHTAGV